MINPPTLAQVTARVRARLTARIPATINASEHSLASVIVHTIAGANAELGESIPGLAKAAHPQTATGQQLTDYAAVYNIERKVDESDNDLRARLHLRLNRAPAAMTPHDWEREARSQPAVWLSWVRTPFPPEVDLYVVGEDGADLTDEQLQAVRDGLESKRPAGCPLNVRRPARTNISVRLTAPQPPPLALTQAIIRLGIQEAGLKSVLPAQVFYSAAQMAGVNIALHSPTEDTALADNSIPNFYFPAPPF